MLIVTVAIQFLPRRPLDDLLLIPELVQVSPVFIRHRSGLVLEDVTINLEQSRDVRLVDVELAQDVLGIAAIEEEAVAVLGRGKDFIISITFRQCST